MPARLEEEKISWRHYHQQKDLYDEFQMTEGTRSTRYKEAKVLLDIKQSKEFTMFRASQCGLISLNKMWLLIFFITIIMLTALFLKSLFVYF